jgi:hypothetical protein
MRVEDLSGLKQWVDYYQAEGLAYLKNEKETLSSNPKLRQAALRSHLDLQVTRWIPRRANALRSSVAYNATIKGAGYGGLVPFGKMVVKKGGSMIFLDKALEAYGLTDQGALTSLFVDTAVAAGLIQIDFLSVSLSEAKKDLTHLIKESAKELWEDDGLKGEFVDELISHFGDEAADEIVHLLPIIGQVWSVGRGIVGAYSQLEKVLDKVMENATRIHRNVIVFAIVESIMYDTFLCRG